MLLFHLAILLSFVIISLLQVYLGLILEVLNFFFLLRRWLCAMDPLCSDFEACNLNLGGIVDASDIILIRCIFKTYWLLNFHRVYCIENSSIASINLFAQFNNVLRFLPTWMLHCYKPAVVCKPCQGMGCVCHVSWFFLFYYMQFFSFFLLLLST